jgi:hypothetical protein
MQISMRATSLDALLDGALFLIGTQARHNSKDLPPVTMVPAPPSLPPPPTPGARPCGRWDALILSQNFSPLRPKKSVTSP